MLHITVKPLYLPVQCSQTFISTCAMQSNLYIYLCNAVKPLYLPVQCSQTFISTCAMQSNLYIYLCNAVKPLYLPVQCSQTIISTCAMQSNHYITSTINYNSLKGCDSNFVVKIQFFKGTTNDTTTVHFIMCSRIALENYNNNDLQFNRLDFR